MDLFTIKLIETHQTNVQRPTHTEIMDPHRHDPDGLIVYLSSSNSCPSPIKLGVRIPLMAKWYSMQLYVIKFVCWFSQEAYFSSISMSDCHDITEILLKDDVKYQHNYSHY